MPGRTKWSDIKAQMSPERRERIAAKTAQLRTIYPPDEPCPVAPMRMLREMENTPLSELATALQTDPAGVLAFEECDDPTVSQLRAYITAIGARIKIIAEFPDGDEVILANFYQKRSRPARSDYVHYSKSKPARTTPAGVVLPTTYRQILQAARDYNNGRDRYNDSYRAVSGDDFRRNLIERGSETDVRELVDFLNQWRCRLPHERIPTILKSSIPEAVAYLKPMAGLTLGDDDVNDDTFRAMEMAFDRLIADKGIAATAASKILGVLNPEFFVAWDVPIQQAIYGRQKCDGRSYAAFMRNMQQSAQTVLADAAMHEIENPAVSISQAINRHPPFTLAHFINNYIWLTVTRGHQYDPGPPVPKE